MQNLLCMLCITHENIAGFSCICNIIFLSGYDIIRVNSACSEIFGNEFSFKLADIVTFQSNISSKVKKCKYISHLQAIRESNVYVTYCFIYCGNYVYYNFQEGFLLITHTCLWKQLLPSTNTCYLLKTARLAVIILVASNCWVCHLYCMIASSSSLIVSTQHLHYLLNICDPLQQNYP